MKNDKKSWKLMKNNKNFKIYKGHTTYKGDKMMKNW